MKKHISIITFETSLNILFKIKYLKGDIFCKHAIFIDYWWFGKYYATLIFIELGEILKKKI